MKDLFHWKNILIILVGNTIYALAVVMFILPNTLITGGTTGIGLFFLHQFGISVETIIIITNVLMFLLGIWVLGVKFALTTLISTFYYPVILGILQKYPQLKIVTTDPILAVIFGGILIGIGVGLVIKVGASTGGLDIPPLILKKKLNIPVSTTLYVLDFIVLLGQMLFSSRDKVLYGILLVIIYTFVLDRVLLFGKNQMQVKIMTSEYEKINQLIKEEIDRGSTFLKAETGYFRESRLMILTVVSNRELPKLNQLVLSVDPHAFMIINQVTEVKGRGFTLGKDYE